MTRPTSIKNRLLLLSLSTITLIWLGAAAFTYVDARHELDEVLDAHLAQASTLLVAQASHELEEIETDHAPMLHKYSRRIAFQVWEDGRELRLHSANAPQTPLGKQEQGFSDATINGQHWRVFSAWDDSGSLLIHVAEQAEVRDALARNIAANLLRPLWIALPLLAIIIWWAVGSGLRPLTRLTREIEQRAPDNLAPLDATATPAEVTPLVERLNQLFVRIGRAMENERRFTADAAHELRTPVAAIKAQAQVARGATDDAVRIHALDGAIAGCDRATHLIEQLLTLARLENVAADAVESCALHALAAHVMAEVAPAALDRGVHLELADGGEIVIPGLPALLTVMLRNLIDNAVRHTPPGTTVRVEVSNTHGTPYIVICDDGPGLQEDELEKISRRFYRPLGTAASGSGLGLSIVSRIAEIHGARLSLSSGESNSGLKVTVSFPHAVQ
jgi:two-component system, OmpR family, sensor histidine kinase QseC